MPITVTLLASDTGFDSPVRFINNSGSLTFNSNIGAPDSTLKFWADVTDTQGANPTNTPGSLLETVTGARADRSRQLLRLKDRGVRRQCALLDDRRRVAGIAR